MLAKLDHWKEEEKLRRIELNCSVIFIPRVFMASRKNGKNFRNDLIYIYQWRTQDFGSGGGRDKKFFSMKVRGVSHALRKIFGGDSQFFCGPRTPNF